LHIRSRSTRSLSFAAAPLSHRVDRRQYRETRLLRRPEGTQQDMIFESV
jgi:hypothetical protein